MQLVGNGIYFILEKTRMPFEQCPRKERRKARSLQDVSTP